MNEFNAYLNHPDFTILKTFFKENGTRRTYPKKSLFTRQHMTPRLAGWVEAGIFQYTHVDEDAAAHIVGFAFADEFVGDYPALLDDIPASVSIQAVTACTVYEIPYRDLIRYWDTDYHTQRYGRQIAESLFSLAYRRLLESYSSPRRRYERLMRQCPTLKETIPLRSIASYLGVTPETVSHIRRDLLKGEKP